MVIDVSDHEARSEVGPEVLEREEIRSALQSAEAVLFRTNSSPEPTTDLGVYLEEFPGLSASLIHALADMGVRIVGTDARSIDLAAAESGADGLPAHRSCLDRQVLVYENLYLPANLANRSFTFIGMPLKLEGCTGSPVRAIALL